MTLDQLLKINKKYKYNVNNIFFKRDGFYQSEKLLKNNRSFIISGLRQIGKSTIMKQLLCEHKDSILLTIDQINNPKEIDQLIAELVLDEGYKIIMIDEIQNIRNWGSWIVDVFNKYEAKYILSGSSSINAQSTLGSARFDNLYLQPLSFNEYCRLTNSKNIPTSFNKYAGQKAITAYTFTDKKEYSNLYNEYMNTYIFIDVLRYEPHIVVSDLEKILEFFKTNTSGEIIKNKLISISESNHYSSNTSKYSYIEKHIRKLEKYNVIKILRRRNKDLSQGQSYKIYLNPHLFLMLNEIDFDNLPNEKKGYFVESYLLFYGYVPNAFYIRQKNNEKNANQEVDFVSNKRWIEVKASRETKSIAKKLSKLFIESNGNHIVSKEIISFSREEKIKGIQNTYFFNLVK